MANVCAHCAILDGVNRHELEQLSGKLWEFLRDAPFKPREETATEGLLVAMHRLKSSTTWVSKATIAEEVKDGHDFLWAVRSIDGRRWLHLRVQAKIMFPSGYYEGLGTTQLGNAKAAAQVAALLGAKGKGQLPVYAFYNGSALPFGPDGHIGVYLGCGRSPLTRGVPASASPATSPLAISLVDADWVRSHIESKPELATPRWAITGYDINPAAVPWECITCPMTTSPCNSPLPKGYLFGRARQALHNPAIGLGLPLGVADTPQDWAALLQENQINAAWQSLLDAEPDADDGAAPVDDFEGDAEPRLRVTPDFLVVTHLREENEQEPS